MTAHPANGLDDGVHQRVRLGILTIAHEARRVEFGFLRSNLELTAGNLSQHLGVLERAGVVLVRREGRERWNELNAVPIQRELERWLSGFQQASASQLLAFERHLQETAAEEKED